MLAPADALPLAVERAGAPQWPQAVARSVQDRCDVSEFDKYEIGQDAYRLHDRTEVGISPVVIASAWLAFFVIAVAHSLASGN